MDGAMVKEVDGWRMHVGMDRWAGGRMGREEVHK